MDGATCIITGCGLILDLDEGTGYWGDLYLYGPDHCAFAATLSVDRQYPILVTLDKAEPYIRVDGDYLEARGVLVFRKDQVWLNTVAEEYLDKSGDEL